LTLKTKRLLLFPWKINRNPGNVIHNWSTYLYKLVYTQDERGGRWLGFSKVLLHALESKLFPVMKAINQFLAPPLSS
jgi:hypothetical protein